MLYRVGITIIMDYSLLLPIRREIIIRFYNKLLWLVGGVLVVAAGVGGGVRSYVINKFQIKRVAGESHLFSMSTGNGGSCGWRFYWYW